MRRLSVALVSTSVFLLNTALVAMMVPVVVEWCRKRGVSPVARANTGQLLRDSGWCLLTDRDEHNVDCQRHAQEGTTGFHGATVRRSDFSGRVCRGCGADGLCSKLGGWGFLVPWRAQSSCLFWDDDYYLIELN